MTSALSLPRSEVCSKCDFLYRGVVDVCNVPERIRIRTPPKVCPLKMWRRTMLGFWRVRKDWWEKRDPMDDKIHDAYRAGRNIYYTDEGKSLATPENNRAMKTAFISGLLGHNFDIEAVRKGDPADE